MSQTVAVLNLFAFLPLSLPIPAHRMHHGQALGAVHDQANSSQQINKGHLARREYRAGRDRELTAATLALELATGADFIGVCAATTAANRLTIGCGPTHFAERLISSLFTALVNLFQRQGAGSGGK